MSYSSNYINVANLPKDLQDRVKVALSDETKSDIEDQRLFQYYILCTLEDMVSEQKLTNKYLQEILGDKIEID